MAQTTQQSFHHSNHAYSSKLNLRFAKALVIFLLFLTVNTQAQIIRTVAGSDLHGDGGAAVGAILVSPMLVLSSCLF